MIAIYKKELKTYFTSVIGYVLLGLFVMITGIFFSMFNISQLYPDYSYVLSSMSIVFLILIPIITMRLFAEEARQKTDQLIFTVPVNIIEIVVGKYLSALTLFLTGMAITAIFPIIISNFGTIPVSQIIGAFAGYILLGACFIAVGIFISVLTDNQIIAAVGTFAVLFIFFMLDGIAAAMPADTRSSILFVGVMAIIFAYLIYDATKNIFAASIVFLIELAITVGLAFYNPLFFDGIIVKVLKWFSLLSKFQNFSQGILNISDIVYYITFSIAFIYLTINVIEKRRWR